ncbi:hypothetical protein pqer_cds_938 [Pandoravirus quercus]|uniref:Uncharacterized protein n=1 Tax=Pandoravirus quercus TaxID=2107709 RepID=A0A2U7UAE8_9VIRU|nr:hypothetical protein pqer_cds_938 [Pandoravirus quercus]AVK75360.1 hypothetical protein pqer_cds_938 [Pandoravirus quercus]
MRAEDSTTNIDHFKSVFPCTVDPADVGAKARAVALAKPAHIERTRAVSLVRIDRVNYDPAPWRQSQPHWAVDVGGDLYHLLAEPQVEGDLQSASCALAWVLMHGMPVSERHPLGATEMDHEQIIAALNHVLAAFDGNVILYTLFWHCGAFLRAVVATLCESDIEAAADDRGGCVAVDETSLRDGLFALGRRDWVAPIRGDRQSDLARSTAIIARTLCTDKPHVSTGCILA